MKETTAQALLQLNAEFYQTFADQFSMTRQRIQPGVRQILETIDPAARVLDLGCGNGELAKQLAGKGFHGSYIGLDFSQELLNHAREGTAENAGFNFIQGNLGGQDWPEAVRKLQADTGSLSVTDFDVILCFATMHHLPGRDRHLFIFQSVRELLAEGGRFFLSNWQFLNSERLRKRIQPWDQARLSAVDVGPGDYLLDWRRGGFGLRYVHQFKEQELISLAQETGFRIAETFYSDGETGNLGLYMEWL